MTTDQRRWLQAAECYGGSFINSFAKTCFAADEENFAIIEPVLIQMMMKFPDYSSDRFRKVGD